MNKPFVCSFVINVLIVLLLNIYVCLSVCSPFIAACVFDFFSFLSHFVSRKNGTVYSLYYILYGILSLHYVCCIFLCILVSVFSCFLCVSNSLSLSFFLFLSLSLSFFISLSLSLSFSLSQFCAPRTYLLLLLHLFTHTFSLSFSLTHTHTLFLSWIETFYGTGEH